MTMKGKTCIITGASAGIGKVAALELAKMGARCVLICRDAGRGGAVLQQIHAAGGEGELLLADLSSQAALRRVAAEALEICPRLDVLLNNAGAIFTRRGLSEDGLELTFATNHLGYFLLTQLLLPRLRESAPSRVVVVASGAHHSAEGLSLDDLQAQRSYSPFGRYAESKLCNLLFARELAKRLEGSGVSVNAMHPGFVGTNFGQNGAPWLRWTLRLLRPFILSPEQGADTAVYLASAPELQSTSGRYFEKRKEQRPSALARDEALGKRLWALSEELCGG